MKSYKTLTTLLFIVSLCISSCTDEIEDNGKFTYIPHSITIIDSASVTLNTVFGYDNLNRIITIYDISDGEENDSTSTTISYDAQGNITEMISNCFNTETNIWIHSISKQFSYNEQSISINTIGPETGKTTTNTIELDNNLVVKEVWTNTNQLVTYQYNGYANYSEVTDKDGNIHSFSYDNKRGVFKHVNMPQWFLTNVLDKTRGITLVSMKENINVNNNYMSVNIYFSANDSTALQTSNIYKYNSFGYPLTIADNHGFEAVIKYTRTK